MNPEVEAVTVKDQELEGLQAAEIAHATPIEMFRAPQQCVRKAEVCIHDRYQKTRNSNIKGS